MLNTVHTLNKLDVKPKCWKQPTTLFESITFIHLKKNIQVDIIWDIHHLSIRVLDSKENLLEGIVLNRFYTHDENLLIVFYKSTKEFTTLKDYLNEWIKESEAIVEEYVYKPTNDMYIYNNFKTKETSVSYSDITLTFSSSNYSDITINSKTNLFYNFKQLKSMKEPRKNWAESAKEMHECGDDNLLMPDVFEDEDPNIIDNPTNEDYTESLPEN